MKEWVAKLLVSYYFGEKFYVGTFWMASVMHILKFGLYKSLLFIKLWWTIWRVIQNMDQVNIKKFLGLKKKQLNIGKKPYIRFRHVIATKTSTLQLSSQGKMLFSSYIRWLTSIKELYQTSLELRWEEGDLEPFTELQWLISIRKGTSMSLLAKIPLGKNLMHREEWQHNGLGIHIRSSIYSFIHSTPILWETSVC